MDTTKRYFKVENDNGEIKDAELLSVFSKNDKEYAIYSIDKGDNTSDLFASIIVSDENGKDKLVNIEDESEKKEIINMIKEILSK